MSSTPSSTPSTAPTKPRFRPVAPSTSTLTAAVLLTGLLLRLCTTLHPYSGENSGPMYGDFEAHRHWMEVVHNLPAIDWYRTTPDNDLSYWGLDYPPLSAYVSKIFAAHIARRHPDALALHVSRGYESQTFRRTMRHTVLFADLAFFLPLLHLLLQRLHHRHARADKRGGGGGDAMVGTLLFVVTCPTFILVDHAHFQYNNINLALFLLSLLFLLTSRPALAVAAFCLCVFFKHLALYYALALFSFLLSHAVAQLRRGGLLSALFFSTRLLSALALTTALVFLPWLSSWARLNEVLSRLIPLSRGLYEDKVSNLWCTLSPVLKLHHHLSSRPLFFVCFVATLVASLPFCVAVFRKPSSTRLILSSTGCALSAFLFSFQVHEKQILLPLLPLCLLHPLFPQLSVYMSIVAANSLFPLLWREGSHYAYLGLLVFHCVATRLSHFFLQSPSPTSKSPALSTVWPALLSATLVLAAVLHSALMWAPVIPRLPYLYEYLHSATACLHLCLIYVLLISAVFST